MIDDPRQASLSMGDEPTFGTDLIRRVYDAATPSAVFSKPAVHGEYMVITAVEVGAAGGFGFGRGFGIDTAGKVSLSDDASSSGGGGGAGGGGAAGGRPVAVIEIGPNGVKVRPIVDVTKLMLGAVSAWVAIGLALRGGRRFHMPWHR